MHNLMGMQKIFRDHKQMTKSDSINNTENGERCQLGNEDHTLPKQGQISFLDLKIDLANRCATFQMDRVDLF